MMILIDRREGERFYRYYDSLNERRRKVQRELMILWQQRRRKAQKI
jgi:hypothetical protein